MRILLRFTFPDRAPGRAESDTYQELMERARRLGAEQAYIGPFDGRPGGILVLDTGTSEAVTAATTALVEWTGATVHVTPVLTLDDVEQGRGIVHLLEVMRGH